MSEPLTNAERRELKAKAQRLEPLLKVGQAGVSDAFIQSLNDALGKHGLVKVKFAAFKEEKKTLAPEIAERSGSELITRVGNVAVFYRRSSQS